MSEKKMFSEVADKDPTSGQPEAVCLTEVIAELLSPGQTCREILGHLVQKWRYKYANEH